MKPIKDDAPARGDGGTVLGIDGVVGREGVRYARPDEIGV